MFQEDPGHHNLITLGIHTDITYLKSEGKPMLSILGFDNEPSYIDVDVERVFLPTNMPISKREREVLQLLVEGLVTKQIAERLFLSPQTISKHRANILKKTNSTTTAELIGIAIKSGWI